jgi:glutaminase
MAATDKSEPSWRVSTGHLPSPELVTALVAEAHNRFKSNMEGKNSPVYPALERVQSDLFGVCVVGTSGTVYAVGDAEYEFTIMSVSKPFVFALVCQELGVEEARQKIGVNATGFAFNSLAGIERNHDGRTNPMVNSGAIATTSLVPGQTVEAKWKFIHEGLSRFAGRRLALNDEVYVSASETNYRNQSIARLLQCYGRIYIDPAQAVDLYNKQCALNVSAKDLAVMGATLADGGVNPITKERVVDAAECHYALAVMTTAGLYETSGDWLSTLVFQARAALAEGSSASLREKGDLGLLPRRSTARATASRDNSWPNSFLNNWEWICSSRNQRSNGRQYGLIGWALIISSIHEKKKPEELLPTRVLGIWCKV